MDNKISYELGKKEGFSAARDYYVKEFFKIFDEMIDNEMISAEDIAGEIHHPQIYTAWQKHCQYRRK